MEKGVEEVLDASARLLAEMKSGTRERTMLSAVTKVLKRRVQDARMPAKVVAASTPSKAPLATPDPTTPAEKPAGGLDTSPAPQTAASPSAANTATSTAASTPERSRAVSAPAVPNTTGDAQSLLSTSPIQQYLSDEGELSKLAYACRLAIIGENGSISRSSPRVLAASLELAAVLLTSGILPLELVAPVPVFAIPESTMSGAQVFFSKLLGGKKSTPAPAGDATGDGRVTASTAADEDKVKENMRDQLVDAVLSAVDAAQNKESSERLFFVTIAALMACAVPRLSRATCGDVLPTTLRSQQLSVHGGRLVRIFRVLLAWCSRPQGLSPILVDEAQKAIHAITRALSKYVEFEAIGRSGAAGDAKGPAQRPSNPLEDQQGPSRTASHTHSSQAPDEPSTASSSAATSVAATPLMPLPAAVARAGRTDLDGFDASPTVTRSDSDGAAAAAAAAASAAAAAMPSSVEGSLRTAATTATAAAAALPALARRTASVDETAAGAAVVAGAVRPLRGVSDMRLLLELCGNVARLTPLTSTNASSGGGDVNGSGSASAGGGAGVVANRDGAATAGTSGALALAGKGGDESANGAALVTNFPTPYLNANTLVTSLSFILYAIVNSGPQFRRSTDVVQVLRQVVVPAAVRTSVSDDLDIFRLSLNLLLLSCLRFGPQMVNETRTVFRHVYFRVLDSTFTSLSHKMLVLDAFASYIEEPQLLLGLFLNYDCNTYSQSIYEMMIHYLGALALPPAQNIFNGNLAAELKRVLTVRLEYDVPEALRRKALVSLLQVADSNIQWIERFECDQSEDSRDAATAASSAPHGRNGSIGGGGPNALVSADASATDDTDYRGDAAASSIVFGGDGMASGAASTHPNTDVFLQARRYKDAFRKFVDLFNDKAMPEAAIEYLKSSVLTLEEVETVTPTTATTAVATPEPQTAGEDVVHAELVEVTPHADESASASEADERKSNDGRSDGEDEPGRISESINVAADPKAATADAAAASDVDDAMRHSARRVAFFLKQNEDYVDKMILGDYFAKSFRKPTTRVVFEEWIAQHDFTGMTLDAALRLFLGGFKLLGEAQVVDRTMELFAAQYCRQNHGVFGSADTAFILSFSICMLNTDAHSPHIKNKMSKEGFLQNNKGIDEGNDVDPAILGGIYDRISKAEIVLRPSPKCLTQPSAKKAAERGGRGEMKVTTSLLDSIPLLRHLAPIATAITDKVLLPMDAAGNALFSSSQRKREEMYQRELRTTLKAVMDALQEASTSDAAHHAMFVTATSIENALPMWEVTVDVLCHIVLLSLQQILEDSEKYVRPPALSAASGGNEKDAGADCDAVTAFMEDTKSAAYFATMLTGLHNTVRVCCAFGNVSHTEQLLEHTFEMTHLSSVVVVSSQPTPRVTVASTLPFTRLHLLSTFLNLFVQCGASFNVRGWQAAYKAMSLVDALANGVEGLWQRQTRRFLGSALAPRETGLVTTATAAAAATKAASSTAPVPPPRNAPQSGKAAKAYDATNTNSSSNGGGTNVGSPTAASAAAENRQYADLWFGALNDIPPTIVDKASRENRKSILSSLRAAPTSHVDLWLDHLFDATQYPSRVQLEMTNGLVKVCEMELQYNRTFSLTKLFDFVSICASFSSRLQWRDLWTHACEVFTLAGCGSSIEIALSSLDGLRLIALTYLMREELLNYSFQKEVLKPFEAILMKNQNVSCRQKVMVILSELIDFRAEHLASGWNVVFSCLSHAAAIPDVAPDAWSTCEGIMAKHITHLKDCFSDLIFCLTTFACSGVDESMPLRAISYLIACGHWLQYGLEAPPAEVRSADAVARWAVRCTSADPELSASRLLSRHLLRVTLAADPLTRAAPLQKPTNFTTKTKYHLWMSLFEGMIPIVVVHSSVRVRAHALSSIWALMAHYASFFDDDVQNSLFSGMVRPMLTTLLTHVPEDVDVTSPPMSGSSEFDRFDYRLLVYFALKGMLLACSGHAHLLLLACRALAELVEATKVSLQMLRNDYVVTVLRVCFDFVWAAPSLDTVDALEQLTPPPPTASTSTAAGDLPNYAERLYHWIPAESRHVNPFVVGLVHEIQQAGVVDVVRFKRTAGWTELHQTPAAQNAPVHVDLAALSATSVESMSATVVQIRATVYSCLTRGLSLQLRRLLSSYEADRPACLAVTAELRRVLLGVSFYYLVTRDARAVGFLKSIMSIAHAHVVTETLTDDVARIDAAADPAAAARLAASSRSSGSPSSSPASPPPVFFGASTDSAVETLLLIPYACVLLEFIAAFDLGEADCQVVCGDLGPYVKRWLDELRQSRQLCVELQRAAQSGSNNSAADTTVVNTHIVEGATHATGETSRAAVPSVVSPSAGAGFRSDAGVAVRDVGAAASAAVDARDAFTEYEGLHFGDVFRCASYPIAARVLYLTPQTSTVVRHRIFAEWCYLLHVYALKCVANLGSRSVLLQACPTRALMELQCHIPSTLEEGACSAFLNSCWEEMNLHCSMPPQSCVELCVSLVVSRV